MTIQINLPKKSGRKEKFMNAQTQLYRSGGVYTAVTTDAIDAGNWHACSVAVLVFRGSNGANLLTEPEKRTGSLKLDAKMLLDTWGPHLSFLSLERFDTFVEVGHLMTFLKVQESQRKFTAVSFIYSASLVQLPYLNSKIVCVYVFVACVS